MMSHKPELIKLKRREMKVIGGRRRGTSVSDRSASLRFRALKQSSNLLVPFVDTGISNFKTFFVRCLLRFLIAPVLIKV